MRRATLLLLFALPASSDALREGHGAAAERILAAALAQGGAARFAQQLSDRVGPRLAGSPGERAAVLWALAELKRLGLEPRTEKVMVPVWVRGEASARIVAPVEQPLVVTALGGSVATPPGGISGEVVEVAGFEELRRLGADRVRGRIVLFNRPIAPGFAGYSASGGLRGARAYAEAHAAELPKHVAAIEADAGGGRPTGLAVEAGAGGLDRMTRIASLFPLLAAPRIAEQEAGADISRLAAGRVPRIGLLQEDARYFDWHHTPGDTFDKIDPRALAESAAFFATVEYVLAEEEETLPRPDPPTAAAP